jgi:hypothetical protein
MDELEADYLRGRVRELEHSRARWRAAALLLAGVLGLAVAVGAAGGAVLGLARARQQAEEDARQAAAANLKQLTIAAGRPQPPAWEEHERRTGLAPVAGGIALAALDPGGDD